MKFCTIFFAILFIYSLNNSDCYSQWETDYRLTNDPAISNTSYNNAKNIASSGDIIHTVWSDNRDGNNEIYYKRSANSGMSWGADVRLTNNNSSSTNPAISVSGAAAYVVWEELRNGNWEIYFKSSTDAGLNWSPDIRLTNNQYYSIYVSIAVTGLYVHIAWTDHRDGNDEIYYKSSVDGGLNWGTDMRLTNGTPPSSYPSISASASNVHVAWFENNEIFYKRSSVNGSVWDEAVQLTVDPAYSAYPSVSVYGSAVYVVWFDIRDGNKEIYFKRSPDGGVVWSTDLRLTNNTFHSEFPSVSGYGSGVHVVWADSRDGNWEIYSKQSFNNGTNWMPDSRLTDNSFGSISSSIIASGQYLHVVWQDNRDGNYEIYYKRNPTGNVNEIISVSSEIPETFSLSQNYPNPFNPVTKIRFDIPPLEGARGRTVMVTVMISWAERSKP